MTTPQIIRLALQTLVFIVWAIMMFRTLFTLRQRGEAETGRTFPSPGAFLTQLGYWLKSDEDRMDRKTLFFLTFVLIAMNLTNILFAGA
ncbi:hypothetical protein V8J82_06520 [Gymnodinialimonas sp. 2305UL16-5]|uniref:hypothetical protein n=1 Tax=Gymnodinialimonas mytili TaxID=3126503 RepID=UPI00309DE18B